MSEPLPLQGSEPSPVDRDSGFECDACGRRFEGEPGGSGLFVWARGEEVRYEEPPLCADCASEITMGALLRTELEDEEG